VEEDLREAGEEIPPEAEEEPHHQQRMHPSNRPNPLKMSK